VSTPPELVDPDEAAALGVADAAAALENVEKGEKVAELMVIAELLSRPDVEGRSAGKRHPRRRSVRSRAW
jgi:molecular chaperone DnaK (HSP70)